MSTPSLTHLSLESINRRIQYEVCHDTIEKLQDVNLLDIYLKCTSVKNKVSRLTSILKAQNLDDNLIQKIIVEYILELIPAGTKGTIRGMKFNKIVKNTIYNINLNEERFEIRFEKECDVYPTSEIPDWYIRDTSTNRVLIGMNQLDLWNGGHQTNRGSKYILSGVRDEYKIVCVVCNAIQFTNSNTKAFKLFQMGFSRNTICYLKNLGNIIIEFFSKQ